ncbi:MAG TPA: hypothetical protein VMT15_12870 [Bryobacteraceae bacterium]|nr:hypothetical protein [Bryobacteraceae bacterium]
MRYWERAGGAHTWREMLASDRTMLLRRCTYSGRPFGEPAFVETMERHFGRSWRRWGFEKFAASA